MGLIESQVNQRIGEYGLNQIPRPKELPMWAKFLLSLTAGFSPLLWVASVVLFISWEPFCPSCLGNLVEACLLLSIIVVTGVFSFYQEVQGERVLKAFESMLSYEAIVKRNGVVLHIPSSQVVVGDIVLLENGTRVPADLRIIQSTGLRVDKSMLTGEAEPVKLCAEPINDTSVTMLEARNMAFMGSTVVDGEGCGLVISTGALTQLANIANKVNVSSKLSTLQVEINFFVMIICAISSLFAAVVIITWAAYLNVYHTGFMTPFQLIANAIGVTVALIPQGLPLSLNLGLSISAKHLFQYSVMVKKMSTIETFGCISFLASDKTGTLTQNKMTVTTALFMDQSQFSVELMDEDHTIIPPEMIRVATFCNQAKLNTISGEVVGGNGIDKALMHWAVRMNAQSVAEETKIICTIPFSSVTKCAAVVIETNGVYEVLVKGAPEYIWGRCDKYFSPQTQRVLEMDGDERTHIITQFRAAVENVSSQGKRVIGIASLSLTPDQVPANGIFETEPTPNFPLTGLVFLGAVAVSDPPKPNIDRAIAELRLAGIQVAMVTGDAPSTAEAIAKQVGIIGSSSSVIQFKGIICDESKPEVMSVSTENSSDLEMQLVATNSADAVERSSTNVSTISRAIVVEGSFLDTLQSTGWDYIFGFDEIVFARTTPDHKLTIVTEQQKRNRIVGVTGDGTNDAPALKKADIGVAMFTGSSVASDAAAVILLKDDFNAVPVGVEEGRLLFINLQNVIAYMIAAGCWAELLPVLATFFLGLPTPLSSLMMIVICLTSDTAAGIALMMEKPQRALMRDKPRDKTQHLVTWRLMVYSYLFIGNLQAIGAFYNYFVYMASRGPLNTAPSPLPVDDYATSIYPIGYQPSQLVGAWNWGGGNGPLAGDEMAASAVGSSVFYTTLVVSQIGHLISIRRRTPYFSDAILNTDNSSDSLLIRLWNEFKYSTPPLPIIFAILFAISIANFWNEVPAIQAAVGTGSVPGSNWGIAIGFSLIVFICGEVRKWLIVLLPPAQAKKLMF